MTEHLISIALAILAIIAAAIGWLVNRHYMLARQQAAQQQWNESTEKTRSLLVDEFRRENDGIKSTMDELAKKLSAQAIRCQEHATGYGRILEAIEGLQRSFEEMKQDFKELHREQHKHGGANA